MCDAGGKVRRLPKQLSPIGVQYLPALHRQHEMGMDLVARERGRRRLWPYSSRCSRPRPPMWLILATPRQALVRPPSRPSSSVLGCPLRQEWLTPSRSSGAGVGVMTARPYGAVGRQTGIPGPAAFAATFQSCSTRPKQFEPRCPAAHHATVVG